MEFDSTINSNDFGRYFIGTYVTVGGRAIHIDNWVEDVDHDPDDEDADDSPSGATMLRLHDANGPIPKAMNWATLYKKMEVIWPVKGYFQHGQVACTVARRALRQYKRAPCRDSLSLTIGAVEYLPSTQRTRLHPATMQAALDQQHIRLDDALEAMDQRSIITAALSNELMLVPINEGNQELILFSQELPAARVIRADKTIVVPSYDAFGQEILDYIRRRGLDTWQVKPLSSLKV